MRVGAADAERAERRVARRIALRPRDGFGVDREPRIVERDTRIERAEVRGRRNHAVSQRHAQLDQPGEAGRRVEVPDLRLQRAEIARPPRAREHLIERPRLDRIAERRARAVRLDEIDIIGRDAASAIDGVDHVGLPLRARRGEPDLVAPVVVERRALDHRPHRIAVRERVGERPEHDRARAVAAHRARRVAVERAAKAVARADHVLREHIARLLRQRDRHAADDGHFAIAPQQRQARVVQRDERARASGLHVDGRPVHVQEVRDAGREKILVVEHQQLQLPVPLADRRIGQQVLDQVMAQARRREHADAAPRAIGRARVLERLPHQFHQHAMLRIEQRRLRRRQVEEAGVERFDAVEHAAPRDVARALDIGQLRELGRERVRLERREPVAARHQQRPQRVGVARAGHARAQADDRDVHRAGFRRAGRMRARVTVRLRHVRSRLRGNRSAPRRSRARTGRRCRFPSRCRGASGSSTASRRPS
ncbi:Uncharacterised protein [Burkholderia pseudomallei]|nr:Uncharacterised protein [Burkholderia pseudomallei]VBW95439.1 Uncharacterised protein [Burkholderia pseudomallei]VBX30361.1 Uncharacterised protein [Burkholderia pseudomallei]